MSLLPSASDNGVRFSYSSVLILQPVLFHKTVSIHGDLRPDFREGIILVYSDD